jgi:hypothetical protein
MIPVADEDHLVSAMFLCKTNEVNKSSLSEAINRDISHPDEELLTNLIVNARKTPASLRPGEAYF